MQRRARLDLELAETVATTVSNAIRPPPHIFHVSCLHIAYYTYYI